MYILSMQNFQEILQKLCRDYGLVIQERLVLEPNSSGVYAALNNDGVYRVLDSQGRSLVLKVAITKNSIAEIARNRKGYKKLEECGLKWFIPQILFTKVDENFAVMLMEYCGENFLNQIRKAENPLGFYAYLIDELTKVYTQSKQKGKEGEQMISSVIAMIKELYEGHISAHLDKSRFLAERVARIESCIDLSHLDFCCFSSWDFTPENIFLTPNGLKYIDPHENVLGIPIIDMACFAGLIKVYDLPQSKEGYSMLREFALTKILSILNIPEKLAYKLFFLGRVLQCFLSAKFRVNSNLNQARKIFLEGKMFLEKIT